jgi:hypothetical protein
MNMKIYELKSITDHMESCVVFAVLYTAVEYSAACNHALEDSIICDGTGVNATR